MTSLNPANASDTRLRRWASWIPLLGLGLAGVVGYRYWTDALEEAPVAEVHAGFLNFMAENSSKAQEYRDLYYKKFGRESVASKHFEQVCAAMYKSAVADNVSPERYSEPMARDCKAFARRHPPGELPR
jgi:hypothetical protein